MFFYLLIILFILALIYLLAMMPKMRKKQDFTPFMGRYYTHRGLHGDKNIAPENSLPAFQLAVQNDYGIEFDIHLTKDKEPIIFHDKNLKRVCGVNKEIKDLTYKELQEYRLYDSQEKIPHLKEFLDLVDGKVPIIVEYKLESMDTSICQIVDSYLQNYEGDYVIESFHPIVPYWYKKNRPQIIRGQLATKKLFKYKAIGFKILNFLGANLLLNFLAKPDFVAYDHRFSQALALKINRSIYKTKTVAYTIQSQKDLNAKSHLYDVIIFDSFIPEE